MPRSRQKETNKDLQIANAKVKYLQTQRDFDAQYELLKIFRGFCFLNKEN